MFRSFKIKNNFSLKTYADCVISFINYSEAEVILLLFNFNHPDSFFIDLSHKGRELHDYRQYILHQSAPSVNGRSDKPEVIFDSVFLRVLSCI